MPEENLLALAKAGDLNALKQLLNQALKPNSAQVHDIDVRRDCLQVSIESANIPDQASLVPQVQKTIDQLHIHNINALEIYGHTIGDELPHWMQQLDILPSANVQEPMAVGQVPPLKTRQPDPIAPFLSTASPSPEGQSITAALENRDERGSKEQNAPSQEQTEQPALRYSYSPAVEKLIQDYKAGDRDFAKSNFNETDLQGINLTLANLQESQLVWANLSNASLGHANLASAQLRHANLSNANLQGAKLQGANFIGANLTGANLSWAELRGANFTDADLTDVNLRNANLERVTMPDGTYLD